MVNTRSQNFATTIGILTAVCLALALAAALPFLAKAGAAIAAALLGYILLKTGKPNKQNFNFTIRYKTVNGLAMRNSVPLPWYERWAYTYLEKNPPHWKFDIFAAILIPAGAVLALIGWGAVLSLLAAPVAMFTGVYCASRSSLFKKGI